MLINFRFKTQLFKVELVDQFLPDASTLVLALCL